MVRQVAGCAALPRQLPLMLKQQRGQAGLPVVHMHHLRLPGQMQRQCATALEKKMNRSALSG